MTFSPKRALIAISAFFTKTAPSQGSWRRRRLRGLRSAHNSIISPKCVISSGRQCRRTTRARCVCFRFCTDSVFQSWVISSDGIAGVERSSHFHNILHLLLCKHFHILQKPDPSIRRTGPVFLSPRLLFLYAFLDRLHWGVALLLYRIGTKIK